MSRPNVDPRTVKGFADEWTRFDQADLSQEELKELFDRYFSIFPWAALPAGAEGFDLGCGSGRWAKLVAPKVGTLYCIEASAATLAVARANLKDLPNCRLHEASVDRMPVAEGSMDFGYSLGVLHHVPDTRAGLRACVAKLKTGAPFLTYLYYDFENRPAWYRALWRISDLARQAIARAPMPARYAISQALAIVFYWPLSRLAKLLESLGCDVEDMPLSFYRHSSFYTMRTDALDRFGTRLEQRFSAAAVRSLMEDAGLERITFSPKMPHWVAVGYRKAEGRR